MISFNIKLKMLKIFQKVLKIFNFKLFYTRDKNTLKYLKVDKIIDVGVANGTKFLLNNFPEAEYFFIEANKDYYTFIENKLLKKYKSKLFKCAAGKEIGSKKLYVSGVISSFHERENFKFKKYYETEVLPVDKILENEVLNGNVLLKIDCEGDELNILKGAKDVLEKVSYVIVEVRLQKIKTYNPSQIINFLYEKNFLWNEILDVYFAKKGIDYLDILFIKKNLIIEK